MCIFVKWKGIWIECYCLVLDVLVFLFDLSLLLLLSDVSCMMKCYVVMCVWVVLYIGGEKLNCLIVL